MKATAFAPGHISAFFEPIYHQQDNLRSGSRGAGITITLGATSQVSMQPSIHQILDVFINKRKTAAPVTKLAIQHLIGTQPIHITVHTFLDLPMGQGFGMSGAGALSSCLALASLIKLPAEDAIKAAHNAEVSLRTGLGDILASSFGGIEIRREAGLPPWGMIEHIPGSYPITLCILGSKIDTKRILTNKTQIQDISSYGRYCTKKIVEKPSIENLFSLGQLFSTKTGLAQKKTLEAIHTANHHGHASMCMLGNSIFAIGETEELCKTLVQFGKVFLCEVDLYGARKIEEK